MTETEKGRPPDWREREGGGTFAGWIQPPAQEIVIAFVGAILILAPAVLYRVFFAEQFARGGVNLLIPLTWLVVSIPFWARALSMLALPDRFRVANGRLLLRTYEVAMPGAVSIAVSDVRAVRTASRVISGKRRSYSVWDVVVDTTDGASHVVRLGRVSADEATWIARRVTAWSVSPP